MLTFASCNSDGDSNIDPEPEEEQSEVNDYTFSYSIKVSDNEGNNLLAASGEYMTDYYNERNIILKYTNESSTEVLYSISNNESNETLLNITVEGEYLESNPVREMTVQWGTSLLATTDFLKYELEKTGDKIQCKKIWVNDELKWENNNSVPPVFSIIKGKNYSQLPPAEPISLEHPEKAKANNQFAFNLFRKTILEDLQNEKENTFVSPLSVNIALSMLVNGAEGNTKKEILNALESNEFSVDQINKHCKELSNALMSVDPSTSIIIANSAWPSIDFPIKESFIQTNINYYDAEVNPTDFTSDDAITTINNWCADKTRNMIPKALDKLSKDVKVLLINALYFKSNWSRGYEFNEYGTRKEPFYAANGQAKEVDMMHRTGSYYYQSDTYAEYLKIPFGNNAFEMVFILPNENKTMQDVIDNIDNEPTWTTSGNMEWKYINLSLPKFKMDFSYEMQDYILPEMGMKIPFTYFADFSRMSDVDLFVSKVIHKTAIEVDENGAAAAAITIIQQDVAGGGEIPKPEIDFNINRPFIFSICEKSTGTILFIGKIDKI